MTDIIATGVPAPGVVGMILSDGRTIDIAWEDALRFAGIVQTAAQLASQLAGIDRGQYLNAAQALMTEGAQHARAAIDAQPHGADVPRLANAITAVPGVGITVEGNKVWAEISGEYTPDIALHCAVVMQSLAMTVGLTHDHASNMTAALKNTHEVTKRARAATDLVIATHMQQHFRPAF